MLQQVCSLRPFLLVFGEAERDETLHLLRDLAPLGLAEHERIFLHFLLDVPLVLAREVQLFEEQLIRNAAQRPHIYLRSVALSIKDFRRHKGISS